MRWVSELQGAPCLPGCLAQRMTQAHACPAPHSCLRPPPASPHLCVCPRVPHPLYDRVECGSGAALGAPCVEEWAQLNPEPGGRRLGSV